MGFKIADFPESSTAVKRRPEGRSAGRLRIRGGKVVSGQSEGPPRATASHYEPRKSRQGVRAFFPDSLDVRDLAIRRDGRLPELKHLAAVWHDQRERLETQDSFMRFNERLHREWAIETGLIERLYAFDRGVTQLLIEHGIDAALIPHGDRQQPESVAAMIGDHQAAVESIFRFVRGERSLSTSYVKEMHALMTRNQAWAEAADAQGRIRRVELNRGVYKQWPNNPLRPDGSIHEYCPPEHVAAEMDRLIELHASHVGVPPEVEAAWMHHRFTQIHPFQDGNGRIARALATLVLVKAGWFPLVVRNEGRVRYLDALELADCGDLRGLVRLFAGLQRDELVKALSVEPSLIRAEELLQATV